MSVELGYFGVSPHALVCSMCQNKKYFEDATELYSFREASEDGWLCINDIAGSLDLCPECVSRVEAALKKTVGYMP